MGKVKVKRVVIDTNVVISYQEILPHFEIVRAKPGRVIVRDDPSDDKFIRCAEAGKAKIVISGDQHLIGLGSYGKVKIVTVADFLEELTSRK